MERKNEIYNKVRDFKARHGITLSWRIKAHSRVAEEHLNNDEEVLYAFAAQKPANAFLEWHLFITILSNSDGARLRSFIRFGVLRRWLLLSVCWL